MDAIERALQAASATLTRRIITTGVLYALSDVLAQRVAPNAARRTSRPLTNTASGWWDAARTGRLALYGALIFAPLQSFWLGVVVEQLPVQPGAAGTMAKVALDQLTMSPFGLALFLAYTTFFTPFTPPFPRDGSWSREALDLRRLAVRNKLVSDFIPTLKSSWAVWIPVQILTMGVVPPRERLLFVNLVALLWNTFLSLWVSLFLFP